MPGSHTQADINASAMTIKRAARRGDRNLGGAIVRTAREAQRLEQIRARRGGLDDLALKALQMARGWAPPPTDDPQINSPRHRDMLAWTEAYRNWRKALEADPGAKPPEAA